MNQDLAMRVLMQAISNLEDVTRDVTMADADPKQLIIARADIVICIGQLLEAFAQENDLRIPEMIRRMNQ